MLKIPDWHANGYSQTQIRANNESVSLSRRAAQGSHPTRVTLGGCGVLDLTEPAIYGTMTLISQAEVTRFRRQVELKRYTEADLFDTTSRDLDIAGKTAVANKRAISEFSLDVAFTDSPRQ